MLTVTLQEDAKAIPLRARGAYNPVRGPPDPNGMVHNMADVIFIGAIVVFFLIAALFVKACDRIIGPDEEALAPRVGETTDPEPTERPVAA